MDFTLKRYRNLLESLLHKGYTFQTFYFYLQYNKNQANPIQPATPNSKPDTLNPKQQVILRHDVDLKPQNSLATAKLEHELGIKGSYYFRIVPQSFNVEIIKEISSLGHEIGYHYETMDTASSCIRESIVQRVLYNEEKEKDCFESKNDSRNDDLIDSAFNLFCENLNTFRQITEIKTICMHGSPRSMYDNREIWKKYNYRELGIVGEPYFDIDFNEVFYLTDTGRRWDGFRVSVRDKISQQETWNQQGLRFKSTKQIVKAAQEDRLPNRIMITVHPQRWTNSFISWAKELFWQNMKNALKRIIIRVKH